MPSYFRLLGWLALLFGTATTIFAFLPGGYGLLAMPLMLVGMGLSTFYLMLSTRHQVTHGYIHPGYVGLLLSSVPLLLIIYFKISQ